MKKVKLTDITLKTRPGSTIYVDVDIFRFIQDKQLHFIEVQILNGENYEYLEEIEYHAITVSDLEFKAKQWILDYVELVEEV